jgi:ABC-type bacteriocin/lantibiotic exporter with double-glycine peptidase domain
VEVFAGSIMENVHLGRADVTADDVKQALDLVGLLETIGNFAGGLETQLTSGGAPLSENQLRRLMLARALVTRPRLLVVDGLLDPLSKEALAQLLPMLKALHTTLLVATCRTSIIDWSDRVIRLSTPHAQLETLEGAAT